MRHLAEDSVIFRQGPINARREYLQMDPKFTMDRLIESRAHYFDFSRAGDMALTAGPYRTSQRTQEDQQRGHGYFVSIWHQTGKTWELMVDIAITVPGVLSLDVVPSLEETNRAFDESPNTNQIRNASFGAVADTEARFIEAINYRGGRRALLSFGLENQRIYVPGMAPAIGREAGAMAYGNFLDDSLSMDLLQHEQMGGFLSASGEMAYTYGTMNSGSTRFRTNYLRLWRYTNDEEWKVAVEVLKPF
ncbi:MAG: hypothetical protein RQ757_07260 [Pseudomonadales bacterium]|nr:hypothetical protein [Pseudomonadales bacterium]